MDDIGKGARNGVGFMAGISLAIVGVAVLAEVTRPKAAGEDTSLTTALESGWKSIKANYNIVTFRSDERCQ